MKLARLFLASALMLLASAALWALQFVGRYGGREYSSPDDREKPSEFHFSRLRYNSYGFRGFRGAWSQDFPRADNDCLIVIRRLTRIDAPAPLNVVDLESDRQASGDPVDR